MTAKVIPFPPPVSDDDRMIHRALIRGFEYRLAKLEAGEGDWDYPERDWDIAVTREALQLLQTYSVQMGLAALRATPMPEELVFR